MSKPGYTDQNFWVRLVFMLIYWIVLNIAITVFGILLIVVSALKLGSKHESATLSTWLKSITVFIQQIFLFLSYAEEEKPFPFQPWPQEDANEES